MSGYIYLLRNRAMPCYYKVGCTEYSPYKRADQLSAASGVPRPFEVLLFIRIDNFQREEQWLHSQLTDFRPNFAREFFLFGMGSMPWLKAVFQHHPRRLEYVEDARWERFVGRHEEHGTPWVIDPDADDGLYLHGPSHGPLEDWELELAILEQGSK